MHEHKGVALTLWSGGSGYRLRLYCKFCGVRMSDRKDRS